MGQHWESVPTCSQRETLSDCHHRLVLLVLELHKNEIIQYVLLLHLASFIPHNVGEIHGCGCL